MEKLAGMAHSHGAPSIVKTMAAATIVATVGAIMGAICAISGVLAPGAVNRLGVGFVHAAADYDVPTNSLGGSRLENAQNAMLSLPSKACRFAFVLV